MGKTALKETKVVHETDNLQMNIYRNFSNVYCHWHDEYEFVYCTRGSCECIADGIPYILNEGELALIGGGQIHSINITPPSQTSAVVIHPHICGSDCMNYFSKTILFDPVYKKGDPISEKIIQNIVHLISLIGEKPFGYELRVKSIISDTFALIIENRRFINRETKSTDTVIEPLVNCIHANYRESISLNMLSKQSNYSKAYIIRLFKRHTGMTPVEYINSYRISKSLALLSNTDMSVLEVSMETGFENAAYFIKLFKKQMGITPQKWRSSIK